VTTSTLKSLTTAESADHRTIDTAGIITVAHDACIFEPSETPLREGVLVFTVVNETDGRAGAHVWGPFTDGHTFDDFAEHVDEEIRLTSTGEEYIGPASWFGSLIPSDSDAALMEAGQAGEISGTARAGSFGIACARTFEDLGLRVYAYSGPLEVGGAG
jgi:hypothetical protein